MNELKEWAQRLKQDIVALWFCTRHPRTPFIAKALAAAVVAYAFSPIDLVPDFIPVLGYLDDVVIVPLGILAVLKLIPAEIMADNRAAAARAAARPVSRAAAIAIALIWAAAIALTGWMTWRCLVA